MKLPALFVAVSFSALLAGVAGADVPLDNLSNANISGIFGAGLGTGAMVDDLELDGLAGTPFAMAIPRVQAVFGSASGQLPSAFAINIWSFDVNAIRNSIGNVYHQIVPLGTITSGIQPYPSDPALNGNFPPGAFLADIALPQGGPILAPGAYYIAIIPLIAGGGGDFFIYGSDTATVGSPNNALHVLGQGGSAMIVESNTNAAYRVFSVPGPAGAGLLGLAGLVALRRRR
ncbi:MAG: hypothetical protein ACT4PL_05000 [Phycisphaerales bacterium]